MEPNTEMVAFPFGPHEVVAAVNRDAGTAQIVTVDGREAYHMRPADLARLERLAVECLESDYRYEDE